MIRWTDIVVDLQYGDCGKGKITDQLLKNGRKYDYCIRYNGGHNCGHTICHGNKKIITHGIPGGVIHGIKSIVGPGCVIDPVKLEKEIRELENFGINVREFLFVDKRVHIIQDRHIIEDSKESEIGTTKSGNGPAYRDKYNRTGIRAEKNDYLSQFLIDIYEELYCKNKEFNILMEGAQGFGLDVHFGDYPYITSSNCIVGEALNNGIPWNTIDRVYGVAKAYETYVGAKSFQPDDPVFDKIRKVGAEYGATTGRPRQVNWIDLDLLKMAADINGVTDIIINKMDVLQTLDIWKVRYSVNGREKVKDLKTEENFKKQINRLFNYVGLTNKKINIRFSYSPEEI